MAYYSEAELQTIGFKSLGARVSLSTKSSIYNAANISLGNDVRIDDYCVLSAGEGGIEIGSYVHIAAFCLILGKGKITLENFSGLSSRVSIYSSSDDYFGKWMTNPTVPEQFTKVKHADVSLGKHVIIGSGSIILPGAVLEEGVAVGALSLVNQRCKEFGIYAGNPAKRVAERKRYLLELESKLIEVIANR